jgi:Zn-finger nucleic acid-binding protein
MNCRNCGAAMQPVGNRSYFRCDHCGTFGFPTTNADGVADVGAATELPCPVCQANLSVGAIEGHTVRYCTTCQGFLATNADFGEIVPKKRNQFADQPTSARAFDPKELQRRLKCPQCRKVMVTHPYGGGGNAVVDTCDRCRVIWLDAQELEVIARYRPAVATRSEPAIALMATQSMEAPSDWRGGYRGHGDTLPLASWLSALFGRL